MTPENARDSPSSHPLCIYLEGHSGLTLSPESGEHLFPGPMAILRY